LYQHQLGEFRRESLRAEEEVNLFPMASVAIDGKASTSDDEMAEMKF
jgi:hypothetical protein